MQAAPLMQIPVFLTLFLAPVWLPYKLLTGWVHAAATVNPMTRILETERGFIAGEPIHVALAFLVAAGLVAAGLVWARGGLHSAERAA
jgi:ABC-2 type transport system permease protein